VDNLGVTSNNTTVLTANTIDRLTFKNNNLKWAVQNDVAAGVIVTAGILTNADIGNNKAYRPNTTTAGGSLVNVGGTTSSRLALQQLRPDADHHHGPDLHRQRRLRVLREPRHRRQGRDRLRHPGRRLLRRFVSDPLSAAKIEQRATTLYAELSAQDGEDASVFFQPA
jgi:hypothetical protein